MELTAHDNKTVTLQLTQGTEFAQLLNLVLAVRQDYDQIDPAFLTLSKAEVEALLEQLMVISRQLPYGARS